LLRRARREWLGLASLRLHRRLAASRPGQRACFERLSESFAGLYAGLAGQDVGVLITPLWENYNRELAAAFLPRPPFGFLKHPAIIGTMFVIAGGRWLAEELAYVEARLPRERLRAVLAEDHAGEPLLLNAEYLTSHNAVHHLYHLLRFAEAAGCELERLGNVVEWGGGYGSLARLFRRLGGKATYVSIDTPLFACLQWLYLSTVLGPEAVRLLQQPGERPESGKVNLLPLHLVAQADLRADLFVSTWALSESSPEAQDFVLGRDWFGARHLLLAYQSSSPALPAAGRVGQLAAATGARLCEIEFLPGNHYAFR
jgi:hypothetical protein